MTEEWRAVQGASRYEVSNLGRARSVLGGTPRLLKPSPVQGGMGYLRITLTLDTGRRQVRYLHQLVCEAFTGPRPKGMFALHFDGVVENCREDNIYWGTRQDNSDDRVKHGRSGKGSLNPKAALTDADVRSIRARYAAGGIRQVDLGDEFGVTQNAIHCITSGKNWTHLEA